MKKGREREGETQRGAEEKREREREREKESNKVVQWANKTNKCNLRATKLINSSVYFGSSQKVKA